ncbi:unnamed protein product, partial [Chrysoparadoxa australica]
MITGEKRLIELHNVLYCPALEAGNLFSLGQAQDTGETRVILEGNEVIVQSKKHPEFAFAGKREAGGGRLFKFRMERMVKPSVNVNVSKASAAERQDINVFHER